MEERRELRLSPAKDLYKESHSNNGNWKYAAGAREEKIYYIGTRTERICTRIFFFVSHTLAMYIEFPYER